MSIRIRVYPQPGSIGLRRKRVRRTLQNQLQQQMLQQQLFAQQQSMMPSLYGGYGSSSRFGSLGGFGSLSGYGSLGSFGSVGGFGGSAYGSYNQSVSPFGSGFPFGGSSIGYSQVGPYSNGYISSPFGSMGYANAGWGSQLGSWNNRACPPSTRQLPPGIGFA